MELLYGWWMVGRGECGKPIGQNVSDIDIVSIGSIGCYGRDKHLKTQFVIVRSGEVEVEKQKWRSEL